MATGLDDGRGEGGVAEGLRRPGRDERELPLVGGAPAAATLVLVVGYRGAGFSGFAEQREGRTVAGELRRALETLLRREVDLTCAGRTDAGVHALGQVVSVPMAGKEVSLSATRLQRALTALVGDDVSIRAVLCGDARFSARFDATMRSYRYRIAAGPVRPVLAFDHAWWIAHDLDVDAMARAARPLVGEHDFRSFAKASSVADKVTSRHVGRIDVTRVREAGEDLVAVDVVGNAFLHNMVRALVGTLVEVGRGHRPEAWPAEVLAARDRRAAGQNAPAKGLTFVEARYPEGLLAPWGEGGR